MQYAFVCPFKRHVMDTAYLSADGSDVELVRHVSDIKTKKTTMWVNSE